MPLIGGEEKKKNKRGRTLKGEEDKLWDRQDGKCAMCGKKLGRHYHIDHKKPIALGGSDTLRNKQLLCPECHMKKTRQDRLKISKAKKRKGGSNKGKGKSPFDLGVDLKSDDFF